MLMDIDAHAILFIFFKIVVAWSERMVIMYGQSCRCPCSCIEE